MEKNSGTGGPQDWSISSSKKDQNSLKKKFLFWLGGFGLISLSGCIAAAVFVGILSGSLPSLESLERIEPPLISKVYDKDSVLIHEFYVERRIWTEHKDIPERIIHAIISIEDKKFFSEIIATDSPTSESEVSP